VHISNGGLSNNNQNTGISGINISGNVGTDSGALTIQILQAAKTFLSQENITRGTASGDTSTLSISNTGNSLLETISGVITNYSGNTTLQSGAGASSCINIAGSIDNKSGSLTIRNAGTTGTIISGIIDNAGPMLLSNTNSGASGITLANGAIITNAGDFDILNSGRAGIDIQSGGKINQTGTLNITNNDANTTAGVKTGIKIDGSIVNSNGTTTLTNNNTADSGIEITSSASVSSNAGLLSLVNKGRSGISVTNGSTPTNKISSTNGISIDNQAGNIDLSGTIENSANGMTVKNSGAKTIFRGTSSVSNTGALTISNESASTDGIQIDGNIDNTGILTIQNLNEANSGISLGSTASITSNGGLLTISNKGARGIESLSSSLVNTDSPLEILNDTIGTGGITLDGTISTPSLPSETTNQRQTGQLTMLE
jgi:hypothetical protein